MKRFLPLTLCAALLLAYALAPALPKELWRWEVALIAVVPVIGLVGVLKVLRI